jgi:hypothetical protein
MFGRLVVSGPPKSWLALPTPQLSSSYYFPFPPKFSIFSCERYPYHSMSRHTCLGPVWAWKGQGSLDVWDRLTTIIFIVIYYVARLTENKADFSNTTGATRRMSSNNVPPLEEPLLESSQEQDDTELVASAQHALPTHGVTAQAPHSATSATAGVAFGPQNDPPGPVSKEVNFDEISEIGNRYLKSPSAGRDWLKGFVPLNPGTDVSLRFVSTPHVERLFSGQTLTHYPSLLPLLSSWLESWFEISKTARSEARKKGTKPSRATFQEDEDIEWLETYICDYLSLPNAGYEDRHVVTLAVSIFKICRKSNLVSHVEGAINVLYSILKSYGCPESMLESFLETLCGARAKLPPPSSEKAAACIHIILEDMRHPKSSPVDSGQDVEKYQAEQPLRSTANDDLMQNKALSVLLGFLRRSFGKDDGLPVNAARGAILTCWELFSTDDPSARDFEELMKAMRESGQKHIIRLDTELLGCCYSLLHDARAIEKALRQDWATFIQLLRTLCQPVREFLANDKTSTIQTSGTPDLRDMNKNAEMLRKINLALERIWDRLSDVQQEWVYQYFMDAPRFLSATQVTLSIQYVQDTGKLWPDKNDWAQSMAALIDTFLKDEEQPIYCRIRVVDVVSEPVKSADFWPSRSNPDDAPTSGDTFAAKVLKALQDQIAVESDDTVLAALVAKAADLITVRSLEKLHAKPVVKCLQAVAMDNDRKLTHGVLVAKELITIFMRAVYFPTRRAKLAFKALIQVAGVKCNNVEARLTAMKLLFRIRCDSAGFIYVQHASESEYIAAALCRTSASADAFAMGDIYSEQRNSTSSTSLSSQSKTSQPLWMYPEPDLLPEKAQSQASTAVLARGHQPKSKMDLEMGLWLESLVSCLQKVAEWETYSYAIVHLGAQLSNVDLFKGALVQVKFLRRVLCEQISNSSFHEPPMSTGLKKSDVAICVFNVLTPLIAYATMDEQPSRNDSDELVRSFLHGIGGQWEGTSRGCIHSLSICCLETPAAVARSYPTILDKMLKNVTQAHLSVHILEFLAELARLYEEHSNLRDDEVRNIFGICIRVLEIARDRKASQIGSQPAWLGTPSARHSGISTKKVPPYRAAMLAEIGMPHYEYALAYHTMITWFLSLKLETRANHVSWIVDRLAWKTPTGEEVIDEQSRVFIDMMQRTTYSDLGETLPHSDFAAQSDGKINTTAWIVGLSIVTIETDGATGRSQITKRQASGTTHSVYQPLTAETPFHHVPISTHIRPESADPNRHVAMLPAHILLQMVASATPMSLSNQPIPLPNDDFVKRALTAFDRNPTVDGYKMGVIYVGDGQDDEVSILSNTIGSPDFNDFLNGLGTRVPLEDAKFNTQGLVNEQDGLYTYAWRDRVSEIIYHVPILMPTDLEDDPTCVNKKRHIGNDFVNIIFNRSGKPFEFDTFPSQFNYVNVVITPANRASKKETEAIRESQLLNEQARNLGRDGQLSVEIPPYLSPIHYKVHVLTAAGFPSISPASDPKIISAARLPLFVRLIGLNACVFAKAWLSRNTDNEYPSSWRARLQEIRQLRDRVVQRAAAAAPEPVRGGPLYRDRAGERRSLYPEDRSALTGQRRVVDYDAVGAAEEETLSEQLDFSTWTQ